MRYERRARQLQDVAVGLECPGKTDAAPQRGGFTSASLQLFGGKQQVGQFAAAKTHRPVTFLLWVGDRILRQTMPPAKPRGPNSHRAAVKNPQVHRECRIVPGKDTQAGFFASLPPVQLSSRWPPLLIIFQIFQGRN